MRHAAAVTAIALILASFAVASDRAGAAANFVVQGTLRDVGNNAPLPGACVSLGPPTFCIAASDANGFYSFEVPPFSTIEYEMYWNKEGYQQGYSGRFTVNGTATFQNWLFPGPSSCPHGGGTAVTTVYLPNITKTLGGANGFVTPFILQNISLGTITALHIDFYRFSDGAKIASRDACAVRAGTSYALVTNLMSDLPDNSQFSVVAQSFMAPIVGVVNEQAGSGTSAEAASYSGASTGALRVFLPNIVRRFFGFHTPFIIQNLGTVTTTATISFVSFDGTKTATLQRTIDPGRSQFVEPNIEPLLADGTQYAATVTAGQPISVVVNTHADDPGAAAPLFFATNGFAAGAAALQGPYFAKGVPGVGRGTATVVTQNIGTAAAMPSLAFTPLGGGTAVTFTGPSLAAGRSWAFDPRYTNGDTTQPFCTAAGTGCLANGEYSVVASGPAGSQLAAQVNIFSDSTGDGYAMIAAPSATVLLPNVTRTLGGTDGWTTPILLQSVTATSVTLKWYRFADGSLVTTTSLSLAPGTAQRIDPRNIAALPDNTQFAVVATDPAGNTFAAIVTELNFQGGDGAMFYGGFAR